MVYSKGKALETFVAKKLKEEKIYFRRFYDAKSGVFVKQPADFFVWKFPQLYYIECKETQKDNSIPIAAFRPYQLKEARDSWTNDIKYYVVVDFNGEIMIADMKLILNNLEGKTIKKDMLFSPFINKEGKIYI